ncbi:MAG: hypothetical protein JXA13_08365 [Anaerolineales bacterium]|nr:hypothetical protein [Anaerolineales bacterium]
MPAKTFPCTSCGAPVKPYPGAIRTVCAYCGSTATIPKDMRQTAEPGHGKESQARAPAENKLDIKLTEITEKVQPVAIKAYNAFWLWTIIRRFLPGCLIALAILCALVCMLTLGGLFLIRQ